MLKFLKNVKTNAVKISFGDYGDMVDFETGLDEFSKIDVDLSVGNLSVVEGDSFHLKYSYPEKLQPEFEVGTMINEGTAVYLRGGGKMGGNMPGADWTVSMGFKVLYL